MTRGARGRGETNARGGGSGEAAAREAAAERAARYRAAMAARVPPEPARGDDDGADSAVVAVVALRFALPDGSTRTRRFGALGSHPRGVRFRARGGRAGEGEHFRLVTRWPRTTLEEEEADARDPVRTAVADPTAALFVEKIAKDESRRDA